MREVTEQYVEREEKWEVFRQDALRAWANYQQTGLHLTRIEADNCLERFEAGNDTTLGFTTGQGTLRTGVYAAALLFTGCSPPARRWILNFNVYWLIHYLALSECDSIWQHPNKHY